MNDNPFYAFIRLVELDQKYNNSVIQYEALLAEIKTMQSHSQEQKKIVDDLRVQSQNLRKQVDRQELEIKALREQETIKKIKLDQLSNPREFLSLQHELEVLSKKLSALEELLFEVWQQQQEVEKSYTVQSSEYAAALPTVEAHLEQLSVKKNNLQALLEQLKHERGALEPRVVADLRDKYEYMRAKVSDPVVPVIDGKCGACFSPVSYNDMQGLRRHKLLACKDCYRLLYIL